MYSCAQCAMLEKSVYCRDAPCLAHMEQGPGPLHPEHLPLPYLPGYWGLSLLVALIKDGPGQWSGHLQAAQPRTCGPWKVYVNIVLYFPSRAILSFEMLTQNNYQMIICIVLIVVIFLGLINHTME
jgi:hypothetical protein